MGEKLTLRYDKIGDILYVDKCHPYAEQESDEVGDYIIARFNPKTGEVENLEVLFFTRRLDLGEEVVLPLDAKLQVAD